MNDTPLSLAPGLAVNLFCRDLDALFGFYTALLGLPEVTQVRSPIYRALRWGRVDLGFHAEDAVDLLGVRDRWQTARAVSHYPTFMVTSDHDVDEASRITPQLGGGVLVPPYATYYGAWQVVLTDPEDNVFRVNHYR